MRRSAREPGEKGLREHDRPLPVALLDGDKKRPAEDDPEVVRPCICFEVFGLRPRKHEGDILGRRT